MPPLQRAFPGHKLVPTTQTKAVHRDQRHGQHGQRKKSGPRTSPGRQRSALCGFEPYPGIQP
eukprot:scaffold60869_cov54-Phaeocystis_antarctica.AAC.2